MLRTAFTNEDAALPMLRVIVVDMEVLASLARS